MKFCPGLPTLAGGTEKEEGRLRRRTGSETVSLNARVARLSQAHESGHIIISILQMSVHVPMIFSLSPPSYVLKAAGSRTGRLKVNNPPRVLTPT